jgi:hypothetical protein
MKYVFCLLSALLIQSTFAQFAPYGFNYQAVVRDANGNAKTNQQVPLQFTLLQSSNNGTVIWQERQVLNTNSMGQCNAVIGSGNPVIPFSSSSFSQINWGADSTFLKVEINANISFTGVFSLLGPVTKLQSVPYALSTPKKAPTIQVFTSGSGTYVPPPGVFYIRVKMVGGGGGGAGGNSNIGANTGGGNGTASNFGSGLMVANGGSGGFGASGGTGGAGGTASIGSGATPIIAVTGGGGGGTDYSPGGVNQSSGGGVGGSSFFGGGGYSSNWSTGGAAVAGAGAANSGAGGGGGASTLIGNSYGGAGGGAGGYCEAIISNLASGYIYFVGAGGSGGSGAGSNSSNGGAGAAGIIIIEEYYQ